MHGIAYDDPTDRHDRLPAMRPDGRSRSDFNFAFLLAVPLLHNKPLPMSMFVFGNLFQSRQAFAFLSWASHLTGCIFSGLVQGRIHAKTNDHCHWIFELAQLKKELNDSKTAICYHDQLALRQPATNLQDQLIGPLGEFLMFSLLPLVISFRRRQYGEKGQSPDATRPRNRRQQHETQPTQSASFNEVTVA